MTKLKDQLSSQILSLPGISSKTFAGKNGELISFICKNKEFAHFHGENIIDIRLTKAVIKNESLSHPAESFNHPKRSLSSPWIELHYNNQEELSAVLRYVKIAIGKL